MEHRAKILLGVTGCIAAYKSCEILRGLQKAGCDVRVVMTENASEFVGRSTFDALSGHSTLTGIFGDGRHPIPHIELAEWCDLFLIAPCTADVIAKIANGIADDLLTSTALAAWDRLAIAPAMNAHMYEAPPTQENISSLSSRGALMIEPDSGRLACGDIGKGKLAPVEDIIDAVIRHLSSSDFKFHATVGDSAAPKTAGNEIAHRSMDSKSLTGKKVLITAGPTHEKIDEVRYIANKSSGKMGYALAEAARDAGADVVLVSGPVVLESPHGVNVIQVETADQMYAACLEHFDGTDISIMAAAVADFAPENPFDGKLKKGRDDEVLREIKLRENPDILANLCERKRDDQYVVGFAAEAEYLMENARSKLIGKNADMIVANDVSNGKVFGQDDNKIWVITPDETVNVPRCSKNEAAGTIIDIICDNIV